MHSLEELKDNVVKFPFVSTADQEVYIKLIDNKIKSLDLWEKSQTSLIKFRYEELDQERK